MVTRTTITEEATITKTAAKLFLFPISRRESTTAKWVLESWNDVLSGAELDYPFKEGKPWA